MTIAIDKDVSAGRRMFSAVRARAARYIGDFLRTPLAWLLIAGIAGASAWHAQLREGNRMACAATSMTIDTQIFREAVAGNDGIGGGAAFREACKGLAQPGPKAFMTIGKQQ